MINHIYNKKIISNKANNDSNKKKLLYIENVKIMNLNVKMG